MKMTYRRPAEVFHPGEFLRDELVERGWTQTEFAEIIERPVRLVNEIIKGKRGITPGTAKELSAALGSSAEFWMNLEMAYQLWKSDPASPSIEHRVKMRSKYPVRDMIIRQWIQPSEDTQVVEGRLLRFFEISSLDEQPNLAFAAKQSGDSEILSPFQLAWLYRVKHIAHTMQVPQYSKKKLRDTLVHLLAFREVQEEIRHVPEYLAQSGVRLVIVEPLPSSKIDGVSLWLENKSPVIGLSLRFDRIDNFWFVLRHEIEHILNEDGKNSAILDSDIIESMDDENLSNEEQAANVAAAEFCIPQDKLEDFIARVNPYFSRKKVLGFSKTIGVHPGLVVGQLQWKVKRYDLFRNMLVSIRDIITPVTMTDGYGHVSPVQV